jgi:predicted nucleic acid-binding protein
MNSKKYNVISDTTPLIALSSIGKLGLLPTLFKEIIIPEAVRDEIASGGKVNVPPLESLEWIKIIGNVSDVKEKLLFDLAEGEKQTILVAIDNNKLDRESLILIDERKGRKIAASLGFRIKGTLGVLAEAKKIGLIDNFKRYALALLKNNLYYDSRLIEAIASEVDR